MLTRQNGGLEMHWICAFVQLGCPTIFWQRVTTVMCWFVGCTCKKSQ